MMDLEQIEPGRSRATRFSYWFMVGLLVLMVGLHLGTVLVAGLFTYLALAHLNFLRRGGKWLAVGIFLLFIGGITYGLGYFVNHTVRALPEIAEKAIPRVIETGKRHGIELPFTDYDSLKDVTLATAKNQAKYLAGVAQLAQGASTQALFLIAGCVLAISLFLNPRFETGPQTAGRRQDLYGRFCEAVATRFRTFYQSFVTVMGAQLTISAINTVLTALFVVVVQLPYAVVIVGVTFLCGLLPVIGNLISNTIVVGIGFTISPETALVSLLYLVTIHKLEYFLNSKIVGWRIRNPLWLTLLGLVIGERLLGIPGIILAPVVLHYIKVEASRIKAEEPETTDVMRAA